jgi:large subunit ribosomal protein L30
MTKAKSKNLKITLVKSLIGRLPKHIEIAKQLGLRHIRSQVVRPDSPCVRGLINVISYMLCVEESL